MVSVIEGCRPESGHGIQTACSRVGGTGPGALAKFKTTRKGIPVVFKLSVVFVSILKPGT